MANKKKKKLTIPFVEATNPEWLIVHLPNYLWGDRHPAKKITHIEIIQIRESWQRVTVLYDIGFSDNAGKGNRQQYVGFIVSPVKLAAEFEKIRKNASIDPPVGRAVTLIPEANLVLAAFPNDRKMQLLQAADVARWLPNNLKKIAGESAHSGEVVDVKLEPLRYVPDKRFTSRCTFSLKNGRAAPQSVSIIAKQLRDHRKAKQLFNNLRALERAFRPSLLTDKKSNFSYQVRIARPLALLDEKPVVLLEEVPGNNLKHDLPELDLPKYMRSAGALLANFHKVDKRVRKQVTHRNEVAEVREAAFLIRKLFPAMSWSVRAFVKTFQEAAWQDGVSPVLLHGSYRLNHIFVHGDDLFLLDLDSIRVGHPAYDIGNFLSSLYYLNAQDRISEAIRAQISLHFLRGYAAHTAFRISARAVLWFLASLLMNKQAFKYITHSHKDRERKVASMLALAQKALACCLDISENAGPEEAIRVLPAMPAFTGQNVNGKSPRRARIGYDRTG